MLVPRIHAGAPGFDTAADAVTYADTGGTVTSSVSEQGGISSDGTLFYLAALLAAGGISIQASADGAAWSEIAVVPVNGSVGTGKTRIVCDPASSAIWMTTQVDCIRRPWASPDPGLTSPGPVDVGSSQPALSVADGHVYVGVEGAPMQRTLSRAS